jgi:chromosome segregation ATPase
MLDEHAHDQALDEPGSSGEVMTRERLERIVAYLEVQLADFDRREQQLNADLVTLDSERRELQREADAFEQRVRDRDAGLARREQELAAAESTYQSLSRQLQQEQEQLARDADRFEVELQAFREEQTSWRERCERELAGRHRSLEEREAQLNRRAVDLEKRTRFQEGHLEKLRHDLESRRRELDAAVQQQRRHFEQTEQQIRRRLTQLATYRELIDRRDRETQDRRSELCRIERERARDAAEQLELLAMERGRLNEQHAMRHADLEQQAGHLRARELDLERRESRLESAREELQRQQHECTVSRAAAETAWNQLCEAVGAEDAAVRLEEQRRLLDAQLQAWEHANDDRIQQLRRAADKSRNERAALREAVAARSECLGRREEMLRELEAAVVRTLERLSSHLSVLAAVTRKPDDLAATNSSDCPTDENGIESDAA